MPNDAMLRDFADRCRRMATFERDPRLKTKFLQMAREYEHRANDPTP